jgi:DNA-directed RNA polymerase omega subunit
MSKQDIMSEAVKKVPSRFLLIKALSKRVDQLKKRDNASENSQSFLFNKALEEIAEGKVTLEFQEKK